MPESEVEMLRKKLLACEQEKALLEAAIRASPSGMLIATHPEGRIKYWNQAALEIRGAPAKEVTDIDFEEHSFAWQT
jgi:PAS domain-containing protein